MYINYGDKKFFEHGILVDTEHSDTEFDMLRCLPYADEENLFQFGRLHVDITDDWIDKEAVMSYIGMTEDTFDPVSYAIGVTDYYSWENFGAADYGVSYDWMRMTKEDIRKELKGYIIAIDGLDDLFSAEPVSEFIATIQKYGENDFSLDCLDLPADIADKVYELIEPYCGCSTRGNASGIVTEVSDLLKGRQHMPSVSGVPCVVVRRNWDREMDVYVYDTEEEALEALSRLYHEYLQEERDHNSSLVESETYLDSDKTYGRITWFGSEDRTEFILSCTIREV